jgi:dienelactone hydrolase
MPRQLQPQASVDPSRAWATRAASAACALSLLAIISTSACTTNSTNPPQPTTGLGADGACTQTSTSVANPSASNQTIKVYEPQGSGQTPLVGGTCGDATRPVVAVVHGYMAASDILYADEINHLVSIGNIVIFATYATDTDDFAGSFSGENQAIVTAATATPRGDIARFGIVGHSMGGGAVPYLAQQAANRSWGSSGMFLFLLAPWFSAGVGTGPIALPAQARVVVEAYDNDTYVDNRIGIDLFNAFTTDAGKKQHVTVRSQTHLGTTLNAQHIAPNSLIAPADAIKYFGLYRIGDALQSCTLTGKNCDADLSVMGTWSDGTAVTQAISTDTPTDSGPVTTSLAIFGLQGECTAPANPRAANCGPSPA